MMRSAWSGKAGVPEGDIHGSATLFSQGTCSLEKVCLRVIPSVQDIPGVPAAHSDVQK